MMAPAMDLDPSAALAAYDLGGPARARPLDGGLINRTFLVEAPAGRFVLQRLHPIFGAELHEDIEAVTSHLHAKGLAITPRLVRTQSGALYTQPPDGIWRLQTFVDGVTVHRVDGPPRAQAAGELVGRFHAALADLRHDFRFRRAGVHDTARHFALLDAAIAAHPAHSQHDLIAALRDQLRAGLAALPSIAAAPLPLRVAHGDLKISNILFDGSGRAICLVDLDTLAEMALPYELGDAWRSWCNPLGEDVEETRFEPALLQAAFRGYRGPMGGLITTEERELLVPGILTICLELSARFARDVLEDQYFGWDAARFPSRAVHNLVRARGQAALYRSLAAQRDAIALTL
jgi:Ser/Thr protein kinase RdoA (MazF antagonist)